MAATVLEEILNAQRKLQRQRHECGIEIPPNPLEGAAPAALPLLPPPACGGQHDTELQPRPKRKQSQAEETVALTVSLPATERITTESESEPKHAESSAELPDPGERLSQLNLWPEPERGSPNAFLRSALFAAIQSEHRELIQGPTPAKKTEQPAPRPVATQKGITVAYKGQQLDQYDLDVWLQAIHLARSHPIETECLFHGHAFLKQIGRPRGQENYDRLTVSLIRLTEGLVVIKQGKVTFTGHLISNFVRDDNTRVYKITFAKEILKLFGYDTFTYLQWKERRALKGKALALWLHGFYSSHARPYALTVDYLHKLSGSRNVAAKSFKQKLKAAFKDLEKTTTIRATFNGDIVTVEREPSGSQAKFLAKHG